MDSHQRRALLATRANPEGRIDYLAGFHGAVAASGRGPATEVRVHYVPDRLIVEPAAFGRYLEALGGLEWASLEELAAVILGDFANELVARWVRVAAAAPAGAYPGVARHEVTIEDRQPGWDNPALLSRLKGE